jgi:hypothetical protein
MPDKHTNLPILDDVIKPGDSDKAVHQPSSKVQSSLLPDDETKASSSIRSDTEADAHSESDHQTDPQSAIDELDLAGTPSGTEMDDELTMAEQTQVPALAEAGEARLSAIDSADLDAITEEILGHMMIEVEQQLRDKVRQTLSRHFRSETGSD